MTRIVTAGLWLGAALVALFLFVRHRQREPRLLAGKWSPRFVRMVAVLLVFLAGTPTRQARAQEEGTPSPMGDPAPGPRTEPLVPLQGEFPTDFSPGDWAGACLYAGRGGVGAYPLLKGMIVAGEFDPYAMEKGGEDESTNQTLLRRLPEGLREVLAMELAGTAPKAEPTLAALQGALDAAEAVSIYDEWLAALLWRRTAQCAGTKEELAEASRARDLARFLGRLERHVRVAECLTRTQAVTGPIQMRPWLSKAAPPKDYREWNMDPDRFLAGARALFPIVGPGTWESEATITFRVAGGPGQLFLERRGETVPVPEGSVFRFGRFDLVSVAEEGEEPPTLVLENALLGSITIAGGEAVSTHALYEFLPESGREKIAGWVEEARLGDFDALSRLQWILPASHPAIRSATREKPDDPGSAPLRLVLSLYDE